MRDLPVSTIRAGERWDASVGRWVSLATAPAPAVAPSAQAAAVRTVLNDPPLGAPQRPRGALVGKRLYMAARQTRNTIGFGSGGETSADAELHTSLQVLRARARQMVRDAGYAKRARKLVVDNVIGSGVGMQAQVPINRPTEDGSGMNESVNAAIEEAFREWSQAARCHTGGRLHFHDLERLAMGQLFEAGEVFIRLHYERFGDSRVPLALEVVEAERVPHSIVPGAHVDAGAEVRMGVEVDPRFHRPIAYWIRTVHPGDIRANSTSVDRYERVPAADVFHLAIIDRWPQTRGEPWLHTALRKLDDLNEYSQHEVTAARGSAAYFATITKPADASDEDGIATDEEGDGAPVVDLEPLTVQELLPGEQMQFHAPNRPNTALDPFMRAMLREVAAGAGGVSYASLSGDYSQSNYSSTRMGLLDERSAYRVLQLWWLRNFRLPLHRRWVQQAVLARAVPNIAPGAYMTAMSGVSNKYEAVRFKCRGWAWIDPAKEVQANADGVRAGFVTVSDVLSQTSDMDLEEFVKVRKRELAMLKAAGILVDTTVQPQPQPTAAPKPAAAAPAEDDDDEGGIDGTKAARLYQLGRQA